MSERPTPEQMRSMGYAASAEPVRLTDQAWVAFCAWVNLDPERVPAMQRWKPAETAEAWERVARKVWEDARADTHHEFGFPSEDL